MLSAPDTALAGLAAHRVSNVAALDSSALLLDQFGAKTTVLCVSNRPGFLQLIKLGNFVCNTKADDVSQFITRMLSLLSIALGHALRLRDQVSEDADVGGQDQR